MKKVEKTVETNEETNELGLHGIKKSFKKEIATSNTKFYKGSIRSGQKIEFEGSLVILGDVNAGAEVLAEENVVALSIATRPDCLGDDVLELLEEMSKKVYLWVELGLQTINDETAENFNRGYKFEVFQ